MPTLSVAALQALGADGLTDLLRRRPEALVPVPPSSLAELAARLTHPPLVNAVLTRLDAPTLQVVEALAALGNRADRERLLALLGVRGDDAAVTGAAVTVVERALARLRKDLLIDPQGNRYRLLAEVRHTFAAPLGLGPDAAGLAAERTADDLRAVLRNLGVTPERLKAELVHQVAATLDDGTLVRHLVDAAPADAAELLVDVAFGRRTVTHYGRTGLHHLHPRQAAQSPVEWAMARFLLVRSGWDGGVTMPAEVALALRGPGWTAPFTPTAPPMTWTPRPEEVVTRSAAAAASTALRIVSTMLDRIGRAPVPLLRSGAVGVRELRRLASTLGCEVREVRLAISLAHAFGLLGTDAEGLAPTHRSDGWQRLPAPTRYALLVDTWFLLGAAPFVRPTAAWSPKDQDFGAEAVRELLLDELAGHPGAAPASPAELLARVSWRAPLLVRAAVDATEPNDAEPDDARLLLAVLDEAAWLGVTGDGALSPAGIAAAASGDVGGAMADILGAPHSTVRLQADLTAVVLGQPDPDLAATLDAAADCENRSTAGVWRFSPASVRRALDAGQDAEALLRGLTAIADGGVPQPLEYLVRDVARRHGMIRGGAVGCYLRSDDEALLTEIVSDRALRRLGLRRLAPTVVVGDRPLGETLDALRRAGHAPVEEGPDGATVITRERQHRIAAPTPSERYSDGEDVDDLDLLEDLGLLDDAYPTDPEREPGDAPDDAPAVDPCAVAAALLADPTRQPGPLIDIGGTLVDLRALTSKKALHALW